MNNYGAVAIWYNEVQDEIVLHDIFTNLIQDEECFKLDQCWKLPARDKLITHWWITEKALSTEAYVLVGFL